MIDRPNELVNTAVLDAQTTQIFHRLIFAKVDEFTFNLRADDSRLGCEMMLSVTLDRGDMRGCDVVTGVDNPGSGRTFRNPVSARGYRNYREVRLSHIARENCRLRCEEKKTARDFSFFRSQFSRDSGFARVEMQQKFSDDRVLDFCGFRPCADLLLQTIPSFLKRRQIGQNKLGVDHFDVTNGINRCADVMNIGILKTADNLHDRVHLSNVVQELIAEASACARAFHETSDIDELDRR